MDIIEKKIRRALLERELNQKEFCEKTKRDVGNFNRKVTAPDCKISFLREVAADLGYILEINFVDNKTGEKL